MKKNNTSRKTSTATVVGYTGYFISLVQLALLLSLTATVMFDSIVQLFKNTSQQGYSLEIILAETYPPIPDNSELSIEIKILLMLLVVIVAVYTIYFIGKHSSNILKRILGRLYKKPTASSLFFAKILIITISFLFIVILLLALPTFATLLSVITAGSVAAIVCFSIQHLIVRRSKMSYKKIA